MSTSESAGPSGEYLLRRTFNESSSGHKESTCITKLTANSQEDIVLQESTNTLNVYGGAPKECHSSYIITVDTLIKLIKVNGKRI